MTKRREASLVTVAADNSELSERTIGCRLAAATGKQIVFYCAFGERSAMAVQAAQEAGLKTACHIHKV
jgi:rhodanese-related sulfurtransferase